MTDARTTEPLGLHRTMPRAFTFSTHVHPPGLACFIQTRCTEAGGGAVVNFIGVELGREGDDP